MITTILTNAYRHRKLLIAVTFSCLLSITLAFFRFYITDSHKFGFLLWNLFLAAIPFGFALLLSSYTAKTKKVVFFGTLALWLLFFPNAPYILTDIVHLYPRRGVPFWFDLVFVFTFAWNGLLLGYLSLLFVEDTLYRMYNGYIAFFFAIFSLSLGAFGIYLGRFDRWNSWDLFQEPLPMMRDIAEYFLHPRTHAQTWAITIVIAAFLVTGYLVIKQLSKLNGVFNYSKT